MAARAGGAAVEFVLILPVLIVLTFGIIDFARFINARVAVANISRETGNLISRDANFEGRTVSQATNLQNYLAGVWKINSASEDWKVYGSLIEAGTATNAPASVNPGGVPGAPFINYGQLDYQCSIARPKFGLSDRMFNHLVYNGTNGAADISQIHIAEVYYKYRPITPLPNFIENILLKDGGGIIVGSKAYF
ncbi:MAG: pilus assembly protein [Kiritimatiellia bacterium]|nr:pilus assembly protein [Kiritimatiellia bacterium]